MKKLVSVNRVDLAIAHCFNSSQPGAVCKSSIDAVARAKSKPHGETTKTSGSASRTSSHRIQGECASRSARRLLPPAMSMSSGIQFPEVIKGSVHSILTTDGRLSAASVSARNSSSRCFKRVTTSPAMASAPNAWPTAVMSSKTACKLLAEVDTTLGVPLTQSDTAARTSPSLTAHTSHWTWVTIASGLSERSNSASTSKTLNPCSTSAARTYRYLWR